MSGNRYAFDTLQLGDVGSKQKTLVLLLDWLQSIQAEKSKVIESLKAQMEIISGINGIEVISMLKNKFGLSKDDAKKIYYKYRNQGESEEEPESPQPGSNPPSTDQKIAMIMDYMKDTTAKLEKIESDIDYLKQQVDRILKQI